MAIDAEAHTLSGITSRFHVGLPGRKAMRFLFLTYVVALTAPRTPAISGLAMRHGHSRACAVAVGGLRRMHLIEGPCVYKVEGLFVLEIRSSFGPAKPGNFTDPALHYLIPRPAAHLSAAFVNCHRQTNPAS